MAILGIGIDIIEVERIQKSFEKFGERFLKRILHPNEIYYCLSHRVPAHFWQRVSRGKRPFQSLWHRHRCATWLARYGNRNANPAASRLSFCTRRAEALRNPRRADSARQFKPHHRSTRLRWRFWKVGNAQLAFGKHYEKAGRVLLLLAGWPWHFSCSAFSVMNREAGEQLREYQAQLRARGKD